MNATAPLDILLQSLATADWDGYVRHLRQIESVDGQEALLADLGRRHGHGVDVLERLRAWPAEDSGRALRYLLPALAHAELASPELLQVLRYAASLTGSAPYRVTNVVRAAFVRTPAVARDIGTNMRSDLALAPALPIWISAYVQAAPEKAAAYATELPTADASQRDLLAQMLETLRPALAAAAAVLAPQADRLLAAVLQDAPQAGRDSVRWSAVVTLATFHAPAMEALMQAARAGQAPAVIALANWLPGLTSATLGANAVPLADVVDLLLQQAIEDEELRSLVDSDLSALLYNNTMRPHIIQRVQQLSTTEAPVAGIFKDIFGAIAENQQDFAQLLTTWLLSANATLVAVRSVLAMSAAGSAPVVLDGPTFMSAPQERQVVACRRLLNLTMNGPALCRFIGVLAEEAALQPVGLDYASQMLPKAMEEFPGATEEFLRSRTRSDRRNTPYAHLYRGVFSRALQWRRVLKMLPKRKELRPTDAQMHALRTLRHRHAQEIMRTVRERSIFSQIATTVHTAQGRRFVSHLQPGPSAISGMAAHSHSVELPSSERSDCVFR